MIRKAKGKYWLDDTEITEEEYATLHALYAAKTKWVNDVFSGSADIEECPEEWRDEVERRVAEKEAAIAPEVELSDAEALEILLGGTV